MKSVEIKYIDTTGETLTTTVKAVGEFTAVHNFSMKSYVKTVLSAKPVKG